jgi:hypothetical protein
MAIQSSGAISLSDLQTEFGGENPIGLDEYYRDGAYVTSNNTNVPTSGAISINSFYDSVLIKSGTLLYNNITVNASSISRSISIPEQSDGKNIWLIVAASSGKDGGGLPTPLGQWNGTSIPYKVSDFDSSGGEDNRVTIQAQQISSGEAVSGTVTVSGIESNNRGGNNETAIWVVGGIVDGTEASRSGSDGLLTDSDQCVVVGGASAGKWNYATVSVTGDFTDVNGGVGIQISSGLSDVTGSSGSQGEGWWWIKI